jgi:hypothetical protein
MGKRRRRRIREVFGMPIHVDPTLEPGEIRVIPRVIPLSRELVDDSPVVDGLFRGMIDGMCRDMRGERVHGPLRRWTWKSVDPGYLEDLSHEELLVEANRLHELAHGLDLDDMFPTSPHDVAELERVYEPVWEHVPQHVPRFTTSLY